MHYLESIIKLYENKKQKHRSIIKKIRFHRKVEFPKIYKN
tara:strand:+ start:3650 stop:3769 length:120 start_codon:yes stop_codon:yes gene_type:complete